MSEFTNHLIQERTRADELFDKYCVLASVQGLLKGAIKHHRSAEVVEFATEVLEKIEAELGVIDKKYR